MSSNVPVFVVVRSESVLRVTDPVRLGDAARSAIRSRDYGDRPAGDSERAQDLTRAAGDVAEAVLELADPASILPEGYGVKEISSTVNAQHCDGEGRISSPYPDFGGLFDVCACGRPDCERCRGFQLTPRTAAVLFVNAQALADAAYDDVLEHGDAPLTYDTDWAVFDQYPSITFRQDAVWRRQAARAFDDLAADLDGGRWPEPRCPAEEMALRLVLTAADAMLADLAEYVADVVAELPKHAEDYEWTSVFESLLQDDDMGTLFSPEQDGIEDPDSETNQTLGLGDYRAAAWFNSFQDVDPRDGRRPFRR